MNIKYYFLVVLLFSYLQSDSKEKKDSIVTQTINYHTTQGKEVYIVWSLNYWKDVPEKKYWPENTFLKDGMAYTKMSSQTNFFSTTLRLPVRTYITYMIYIPIDDEGDSTDGWDTYGPLFYSSNFLEDKTVDMKDDALWMPEKKKGFDILRSGLKILIIFFIISVILTVVFRKRLSFSKLNLFTGLLIGSVIMICIIRMQMNNLGKQHPFQIFGAIKSDLLWLFAISAMFYLLMYAFRKSPRVRTGLLVFFVLILLISILLSILNIEIVQRLGRPLNYQWLYYSDFMNGTDAKNALAYNMTSGLKLNIVQLLFSVMILGITYSFLDLRSKYINRLLGILPILLLSAGYIQANVIHYNNHRTANPVLELITSAISAGNKPQLFSMPISKETLQFIKQYHSVDSGSALDSNGVINNVILFVLESTAKRYVSLYDSTYNVTPHLKEWSTMATVFNNMYIHIPSTSNSMLSLLSGIYPQISFKSLVKKSGEISVPSLPKELEKANWISSILSSSDLTFGNMADYAKETGFMKISDSRSMNCGYKRFEVTNTLLDGLDDKCIIPQYFSWLDTTSAGKKFSMFWTNQTHYPYAFDTKAEVKYVKGNDELNRYLNALKNADEAFGMLIRGLESRNILQNTMIIVVGDHGEAFGTHGQTGHGSQIYEENVAVPCMIYSPLLFNGKKENKITSLIDVAPTILNVLGIPKPSLWQGKSLFANTSNERAFFICPYSDFLFGTRSQNWKYIFNATLNTDELYDLNNDPLELNNVAKKYPEVVKKEYEILGGWVQYHNKFLASLNAGNK